MMLQFIEWLNMGGYAMYVWSSYILGILVLFLNVYTPLRHYYKQRAKIFHKGCLRERKP